MSVMLHWRKYTDKSIVVYGDTYPHRATLKAMGGRFNANLSVGKGWVFKLAKEAEIAAFCSSVPPSAPKPSRSRSRYSPDDWDDRGDDGGSDMSWAEQRAADLADYASQFDCPIQRAEIRAGA